MRTNEAVGNRVKKEDRKALKSFIIRLLVAMLVGGIIGYGTGIFGKKDISLQGLIENASEILLYVLPAVHAVLFLILGIVCAVFLGKAKKLFASWDGEDEETDKKLDGMLSFCTTFGSLATVINLMFYISEIHVLFKMNADGGGWMTGLYVLILALAGVETLAVQKKAVDFYKQINPEKRGSIYDLRFAKRWEESCDEAEQYRMYKAGYAAFRTTQISCVAGCIFGMLADFALDTGLLPILVIGVVWLATVISYIRAEKKTD